MMNNKPYIGVTGFMTNKEVESVLSIFPENSNRILMAGVLASTTTVMSERPSKFNGRYPVIDDIEGIFTSHPRVFNAIHFHDKTRDDIQIFDQMQMLTLKGGKYFHGFQLNIKWPNPEILRSYRSAHPKKKIILQVGGGAFKDVNQDPATMAKKIKNDYGNWIDYVLIDPSGGEGKKFDIQMALLCLRALETTCDPKIGFGIAGGLCHDNVNELLLPVITEFPNVSIDAEGKLRDSDNGDVLNVGRTLQYVQAANKLLGNV